MKSIISGLTLKALSSTISDSSQVNTAFREIYGERSSKGAGLPKWIGKNDWEYICSWLVENANLKEADFFKAGLSCLELGLMGSITYLPLFIGSPALLFHNVSNLLASLDNISLPGIIYVGEESCLIEIATSSGELTPSHYLEFLRGYFCAAAELWNCTVQNSECLRTDDKKYCAIKLDWNISELHNRRALEELLIEREFFGEMFEGLGRISDTNSADFSPLLKQNVKLKQRRVDSKKQQESYNSSAYRQTRLYDGYIGLDDSLRIVGLSSAVLDLLDYPSEEVFLEKNRKLEHLLVRDSISARGLLDKLSGDKQFSHILNVINGHGMYQEINVSLSSEFALAPGEKYRLILRDMTLAKKLNLPLEPTRQVLDALFTNNPAALQIIDPAGQTTKVNRQFEDLFGLSAVDFIGNRDYNILKDEDAWACGLLEMLNKVFSTSERNSKTLILGENRKFTSPLLKNISEMLVLDVTIFPLTSVSGQSNSVIVSYSDITDSFLSQQQLAQTDKLRSIGTLTSGIAHDFNNILGAIVPNADFIMSQAEDNDLIHRKARAIKSASKRASELMKQLMTYARQSKLNKQSLSFNTCVGEALELIQNAIPKTVAISFEKEMDQSCTIMADPLQMQQLLINLMINASDAQPEGGQIRVQTKLHELRQRITFGGNLLNTGDYVCVSVKDKGHGMSREVIDRVFDPFFTTKEKGRGTGLGLSVVHGIVKNHQGYIDIESHKGSGTTFSIFLPLTKDIEADEEQ